MTETPYWIETLPPAALERSTAQLPERADVAIVGAGYTGLAAARRLAKAGASVVVLEREHIGFGASARNGGQVITGLRLGPAALVGRYGERRARSLFEAATEAIEHLEALIADESIDCDYRRSGHIQAASKPSHFAAFREEQALLARVFDHRVELLSREHQRSELGSDAYHGLLIDERSGSLNPAQYVHGLASAAERAGASIVTGAGVERITAREKGWDIVSARGTVAAREVMFATNAYGGPVPPALRRAIVPIGSYIVATEPLTTMQAAAILPKRRMAFDSRNFLFYFRLTADGRLLFGGRAEFTEPTAASTARAARVLRDGLIAVFPELAGARVDYAWSGRVAFTRDEMPHAGRLGAGTYFAAGYCGHGIAMATLLGDRVGRRILGEPVASPLMDDRTPAFPLYDGTPWFLPFAGAYYRVMDWIA